MEKTTFIENLRKELIGKEFKAVELDNLLQSTYNFEGSMFDNGLLFVENSSWAYFSPFWKDTSECGDCEDINVIFNVLNADTEVNDLDILLKVTEIDWI